MSACADYSEGILHNTLSRMDGGSHRKTGSFFGLV
jgi:hypothetical protein